MDIRILEELPKGTKFTVVDKKQSGAMIVYQLEDENGKEYYYWDLLRAVNG